MDLIYFYKLCKIGKLIIYIIYLLSLVRSVAKDPICSSRGGTKYPVVRPLVL
ncbi:hypothetical protein RhiirC2_747272 [Rhizophagus irregularis]|uniref:Uncharacterized protein n=1 Tax=Rhizophagus irregularis TaxID=588596 RepID=A0A2N1N873_9GLOM|nr:hypothetical protein RhiirC2_747272 [Rhizophagus irregularis]